MNSFISPRYQHLMGTKVFKLYKKSIPASIVGAIMVVVCCLSSCVTLSAPPAGQPVVIQSGQSLVYGRIRMLEESNENIEWNLFKADPWDQVFGVPHMTLELHQLFPPGGMFNYKVYPGPPIESDGSFFWVLSAGDYELYGNPRAYGSDRFSQEETAPLARFSVTTIGRTIYLGTLIIDIDYDYTFGFLKGEARYEIRSFRVVDDREQATLILSKRFPAFPEPVVAEFMRTE